MVDNLQIIHLKMASALRRLNSEFLGKQSRMLDQTQNGDGGWGGREGPSDLYYTGFGARAADLLGYGDEDLWNGVARYLRHTPPPGTIVDALSFAEAQALAAQRLGGSGPTGFERDLIEMVESFRKDGSYVREKGGGGSVYQTFLAWRTHAALGAVMPDADAALRWVASRQREDGGFAESEGARASGVNPTVAGFQFLSANRPLCVCVGDGVGAFLAKMQRACGGFAAHENAPEPDLLSTFTSLITLAGLGGLASVNLTEAARFVKSLACPEGGFRGTPSDSRVDVEYTFYGLGCLGLLASAAGQGAKRAD